VNRIGITAADAAGALDRLRGHLDGALASAERAQPDAPCQAPDLWLTVGS